MYEVEETVMVGPRAKGQGPKGQGLLCGEMDTDARQQQVASASSDLAHLAVFQTGVPSPRKCSRYEIRNAVEVYDRVTHLCRCSGCAYAASCSQEIPHIYTTTTLRL